MSLGLRLNLCLRWDFDEGERVMGFLGLGFRSTI